MAGINFKDIALLTYGDIDNGRIYYARRKTGKMMNCCLTEQAQEIIDKYHTDQVEEDYLFLILDRQIHTTEKQILERVKKTLKHVNKRLHELSEEIGLHTLCSPPYLRNRLKEVRSKRSLDFRIAGALRFIHHSNLFGFV